MTASDSHGAVIELCDPPPAEVVVGAELAFTVRVVCPAGCDLAGAPLTVATADGIIAVPPDAAGARKRAIALTAPSQIGEHVWRIVAGPHEVAGILHKAVPLAVTVRMRPHETSLAVWGMPSPVVRGQSFAVTVGAKSAAGCDLNGCRVEIRDENDAVMSTGALGATPWPGTSALYWTELELQAPAAAGMFAWSVRFEAAELALAHSGAAARFSIAIVEPPQHRLTVKVIEQETAAPIADAQLRLGAYHGATGESGLAEIMMPEGTFDLTIWKPGFEAPVQTLAINADLMVEVALAAMPEENPDAAWLM